MRQKYRDRIIGLFASMVVFLTVTLWVFPGAAQAQTHTWIGGATGNWNVLGNWDAGSVPNGAGDIPLIDGDSLIDAVVNLDMSVTLGGLTIDSGDHLTVTSAHTLELNGAYVENNGTIEVASEYNSLTYLTAREGVTLTGAGQVVLGASGQNRMDYNGTYGGSFVNEAGHTIRGGGTIRAPMVNRGTISGDPDDDSKEMAITGGVENDGGILTTGGANKTLSIQSVVTDGQVNPNGGLIELVGGTLQGVTGTTIGAGSLEVNSTGYMEGLLLNGGHVTVTSAHTLELNGAYVENNGTIEVASEYNSLTYLTANGDVTLTGAGQVVLGASGQNRMDYNGTYGGSFLNEAGHTIRGGGTIRAPMVNRGTISGDPDDDSKEMAITGGVENGGGILTTGGANKTLSIQSVVTDGQVNPNGGLIELVGGTLQGVTGTTIGAGSLEVNSTGYMEGMLVNGGHITVTSAHTLELNGAYVENNGTIEVASQANSLTYLTAREGVTFTGAGQVVLGASGQNRMDYNGTYGGSFLNEAGHTIRGGGTIRAPMVNRGTISGDPDDDSKEMAITGGVENGGGILTTGGANKTLSIQSVVTDGQVNPNGGLIELVGGTLMGAIGTTIGAGSLEVNSTGYMEGMLVNGGHITVTSAHALQLNGAYVENNGTIEVASQANSLTYLTANGDVTFTGAGQVVLGASGQNRMNYNGTYGGSFVNELGHTIRGGGRIQAAVENNGTLRADNGTMNVEAAVTGQGQVEIADGATMSIQQNMAAGDFSMSSSADLQVSNGVAIDLTGDFIFEQTDEGLWDWGTGSVLRMSGSGQYLEVGGRDLDGFTDNFSLPSLEITGVYASLLDNIDNGNRSSPEALYVGSLTVEPGSMLNLNGINLYANSGSPVQVHAGDGYLYGGGTIVDEASVAEYYVDPAGTDDGAHGTASGTEAWQTIHYAVEQINLGTPRTYVLYVAAGGSYQPDL